MKKIILVTGNPDKLQELQTIAPDSFEFDSRSIDLPEIQSLGPREIITDKVLRAYAVVKSPVIVEDVSVGLDDLGGLPGPFYKFFRKKLGDKVLLQLAKVASDKITVRCDAAYYDGHNMLFGEGIIRGKIVEKRGNNGFGFDPFIVPEGHSRTMAEMTPGEKHEISHRGQAFRNLIKQFDSEN